jgi:predicted alpha/beta-fold hydrolase
MYYPKSPIYMVGTSFGGNYLMRYLSKFKRRSIKGLIALAAPMDVGQVVRDMPYIYQKFFVKRYIEEVVTRHK